MQALFKEIVNGDAVKVLERLGRDPRIVAMTATAPPKKYGGQSPL